MSRIAIIVGCACALGNLWAGPALSQQSGALGTLPAGPAQSEQSEAPAQPVAESSHVVTSSESSAVEAIRKALDEKTKLDFTEQPLDDVVFYLRDYHHIPIQLDVKALEDMSIGTDTPVTRNVEGISLRSALRLMLASLDLTYIIKDEVLLITTPDVASNTFVTKIYPVGDLTARQDAAAGEDFESLIQVIRSTIAPKAWSGAGGMANVVPLPAARALVIMQTDDAQQEIGELLAGLRRVRDGQATARPATAGGAGINLPTGTVTLVGPTRGSAGADQPPAAGKSATPAKK
jgi:hypothetical protein